MIKHIHVILKYEYPISLQIKDNMGFEYNIFSQSGREGIPNYVHFNTFYTTDLESQE